METINTNSDADKIRSHIIIGSIPVIEEQTADHKVNTPIIMNDNTNNSNTVQTAEQPNLINLIVTLACGRGSRIVSTLEKINDYIVIGLNHKANHARYNLARNISKRIFENPTDRAIEEVYDVLVESASIVDAVNNFKQTNKPTSRGGVLHSETVTYAVRLINGGLLRSSRVATALERVALRMVASGDFNINDMPVSLDKELNKAYSAIRSQATKNGEELGGKSNTVTKEATKEAIVKAIQIMKETDSYEYDILIGNLPEQPKHLKE